MWANARRPAAALVVLAAVVAPAAAGTLTGPAQVIDGDGLMVAGREIRLHGIDAPEWKQKCQDAGGRDWPCGATAKAVLESLVAGRTVACVQEARDGYGRVVATCFLDGQNLNAELVRRGMALAYRKYSGRYVADEAEASTARQGVWAGTFTPPWEWRSSAKR